MNNLKNLVMLERLFRLVWACVAFATLFMQGNWLLILWVLVEIPTLLFGSRSEICAMGLTGWLIVLSELSLLGVPLLILLNMLLVLCPFNRQLRTIYRISTLILFPLIWCLTFMADPTLRTTGFWSNTAVVTVAGLVEITFLVGECRGRWRR